MSTQLLGGTDCHVMVLQPVSGIQNVAVAQFQVR